MMNLTFGEQVKIILSRKGMTIKQLAEEVEKYTGKPMSRQNMTQRLGRDNFQEQDMRMIAEILGCKFTLSIMEVDMPYAEEAVSETRDITVGELHVHVLVQHSFTELNGKIGNCNHDLYAYFLFELQRYSFFPNDTNIPHQKPKIKFFDVYFQTFRHFT